MKYMNSYVSVFLINSILYEVRHTKIDVSSGESSEILIEASWGWTNLEEDL